MCVLSTLVPEFCHFGCHIYPTPWRIFSIFGGLVAHIHTHPTSQSVWQYHSSLWRYSPIFVTSPCTLSATSCQISGSGLTISPNFTHSLTSLFSLYHQIASHSEQPFLPTVASTLCPHFVPYLLHLCRYTRGNLYTATRRATLDTCQTSLKSHQPFRRYSHIFSICPVESAATKTLFLHQYLSISPTIWRIEGRHIPLPFCVVEAQSELWLLRTSHLCVPSFFPVLSRSYPPPFPFLPYSLLVLCCLLSVQCV